MAVSRIKPFNPTEDDVESWTSVLQNFLIASGVDKTKERDKATAILLSSVGVSTYTLIKDLVSPNKPEESSFNDLVDVLIKHYKPAPKAISERFKFYNRKQLPNESVTVFLSELRKLAVTCKFEKLDISLRDQFVVGLSSEAAQKRLFLENDDLKLDKAIQIAISQESADASTQLIRGIKSEPVLTEPVHKVQSQSQPATSKFNKSHDKSKKTESSASKCSRCGNNHNQKDCPFKDIKCYKCEKTGHFAKYCKSKSSSKESSKSESCNNVRSVQNDEKPSEIFVEVKLNGNPVKMEFDTGSTRSFISSSVWKSIGSPRLQKCFSRFTTYTNQELSVKGQFKCQVSHNNQSVEVNMLVTDYTSLFGRDLLQLIQVDWVSIKKQCNQVHRLSGVPTLKSLLEEYKEVFDAPVGTVKNFKAKLVLKEDAIPKFFKARPVPYALRDKVDEELIKMESQGVITRVEHSDWASPLVVVPKANGKVRITGDFKKTINSQLCVNQYPLARVDDLLETISGGHTFSKLDGSDAFHQIQVEESCRKFLVINTHRGLYQYNVLPQGIASSPAIFQEMMDSMLRGIPKSGSFVDDVITTGKSDHDHVNHLSKILSRMRDANYRLSRSKCEFLQKSVKFLGNVVSKDGVRTDPGKIEAIMSMKQPQNVSEVKSFLGLVNFYAKFVPHLSTICEPMNALTRKDVKFKWSSQCDEAFNYVKKVVSSSSVLVHYDQNLPVGISCDASSVGLGVVLFHRYPDGSEKPIAYVSKTLSSSEKNYSQIEKEGLSIMFGIKKFMKYLFGRRFILITDHNPLLAIFGSKKDVPSLVATRLHRWSLFLSGFNYDIEYRNTTQHGNADSLSRLPVPGVYEADEESNNAVKRIQEDNPLTSKEVRYATSRDPVLCQVVRFIQSGWPQRQSQVPKEIHPFFSHRFEYTFEGGILMWGIRVVVPKSLRKSVLNQLHDTHPGIVRMKSLARQFVFWPGIDNEIEDTVKSCHTCASSRVNPPAAPLHPWSFPEKPWQRVHVDLAGPFHNSMWLIMVDAYSKWPEVFNLGKDTTSTKIVRCVRETIARFGIPDTLVSDNGPQFVSQEFKKFCTGNGIRHTTSSAYHPRSNGEAERFVRTFKGGLSSRGSDLNLSLCDFLLSYRLTPHATTGQSPSELMLKNKPKSLLDLLRPNPESSARKSQEKSVENSKYPKNVREFTVGSSVWIRTFSRNESKWSLGKVLKKLGPLTYYVDVEGRTYKRHVDHIVDGEIRNMKPSSSSRPYLLEDDDDFVQVTEDQTLPEDALDDIEVVERRYPIRDRRPPVRFSPS